MLLTRLTLLHKIWKKVFIHKLSDIQNSFLQWKDVFSGKPYGMYIPMDTAYKIIAIMQMIIVNLC